MLRIWPLYYLYLAFCGATYWFFGVDVSGVSIFYYVFLLANVPFILGGIAPMLSHYWSLGVEEQFYLFWPWIVQKSKHLLATVTALCAMLIILKVSFRVYDIDYNNGVATWPYLLIHVTRFHCMMIGAIGAILYFHQNLLFLKISNHRITQFISWTIILAITLNQFHLASVIDNELVSVVAVFLIIGQIEVKNRLVNLESDYLNNVGKISYGIYVLHPLVIFYVSKALYFPQGEGILPYMIVYIIVIATTYIVAWITYHYFEKQFLFLKQRYSAIETNAFNKP
jgi:peptidoglycan/LPS O-acetylase OafA/YrhL